MFVFVFWNISYSDLLCESIFVIKIYHQPMNLEKGNENYHKLFSSSLVIGFMPSKGVNKDLNLISDSVTFIRNIISKLGENVSLPTFKPGVYLI